jgi:uncharacterized protein (DUF58 family)
MEFDMLPHFTAYLVGFALVAVVAVAAVLTSATLFFTENHAIRVRRHEGLFSYYGHLVLGH